MIDIAPSYASFEVAQTHQVDKRFDEAKNDFACLLFTLISIVEHRLSQVATVKDKKEIYRRAVSEGAIKTNCYVNNHKHVMNIAVDVMLGRWPIQAIYIARAWSNGDVDVFDKERWEQNAAQYWALEWKLKALPITHFNQGNEARQIIYEPYPGLPLSKIVSIRHYAFEDRA